jgi:hypothetical protein
MAMPTYEDGGLLIPTAPPSGTYAARLRRSLQEFESQLKETENFTIVAMIGGRPYAVEHIAVRGSELAVIDGPAQDEQRYRLLCHVGSLQLVLQVEPKKPHETRKRIGFIWDEPAPVPGDVESPDQSPERDPAEVPVAVDPTTPGV